MITADNRYILNKSTLHGHFEQLGTLLDNTKNVIKAVYDFSVGGGAIGDITLKDVDGFDVVIPSAAIVTRVFLDVLTAPTSGGSATVALKSEAAADLLAATAIASLTGRVDGKPDNTASKMVKMTADRTVKATVAVAALTAGKINVFIEYVLSN